MAPAIGFQVQICAVMQPLAEAVTTTRPLLSPQPPDALAPHFVANAPCALPSGSRPRRVGRGRR
jgi:hypothetical protein